MAAPERVTDGALGRHPLVQRILDGAVPDAVRLSAARGALPIPVQDLLALQVRLVTDPVPAVAQAAAASLNAVTTETIAPLLRDPACDPAILDHFARAGRLTGDPLALLVAHPALLDESLEAIATGGSAEALNLVVTNEVRIIGNPHLVELLRANPNLSPDNRRRLIELARDFIGKENESVGQVADEEPPLAMDAEALPGEVPGEVPEGEAAAGEVPAILSPEEEARYEEELRKTPAYIKIMKLQVGERIQLALKGNAEERAVLVRDTARVVAMEVLKSPKLSDSEIGSFAAMRNVHEEVLRKIASNREWTKSYSVVHNLVRNPKTPAGLSVRFVARLGTRDLKILQGDKNIPEVLRRQIRIHYQARTMPKKKLFKKAH